MENKKTSELLDLLGRYSVKDKERNEETISDKEIEDYIDANRELLNRYPFKLIFTNEDYNLEEDDSIEKRLDNTEKNSDDFEKKIRRHKHDERSGDVMIRI